MVCIKISMRNPKSLNDEFFEVIVSKYVNECRRQNVDPSFSGLLAFVADRQLIDGVEIARFMVLEKYPRALYEMEGVKSRAVLVLEDQIGASERFVWDCLKNHRARFEKKSKTVQNSPFF